MEWGFGSKKMELVAWEWAAKEGEENGSTYE
jgi:hypothetical protein